MKLKSSLHKNIIEAGCDEAGRGCLAGPVFAAAVILPENYNNPKLDDSKKLSENTRIELRKDIIDRALEWAVASVDAEEIDEINILNASFLAMHRAIDQLKTKPGFLLIDGNRFNPYKDIPYICVIGGDGKYLSIAAASILAKTFRDDFMREAHKKHPHYSWNTNKGYPTLAHKMAIQEHGFTNFHRKTFNANIQMKLGF